jgi:small subunit ribosomal protein S18
MTNEETHVEENDARDEGVPYTPSTGGDQRRRGGRSGGGRQSGPRRRFQPRRKICSFCVDKVKVINYKDADTLRRFLDDHGKIIPRRKTGTCAKHQRRLAVAVKRARYLALLPFTARRFPHL